MKITPLLTLTLCCIFTHILALEARAEPVLESSAFTPERILPDGVDSSVSVNPYNGESGLVRKGTVAATLNNIALLNTLLIENPQSEKIKKIFDAIQALIPSLRVVGMFDLFTCYEWLSDIKQPGRVLTAVLYVQAYPQEMNEAVKARLVALKHSTKIAVLRQAIDKALNVAS